MLTMTETCLLKEKELLITIKSNLIYKKISVMLVLEIRKRIRLKSQLGAKIEKESNGYTSVYKYTLCSLTVYSLRPLVYNDMNIVHVNNRCINNNEAAIL